MQLIYRIVKLPYGEAVPALKQSLQGYLMHWERVKVGVSSRPDLRCEQLEDDGWDRMYVLYKAFRADFARDMERELISHARNSNYILGTENILPGGEGINDDGKSFVYVIVADKR